MSQETESGRDPREIPIPTTPELLDRPETWRFNLIEVPSGEWPVVRLYRTVEELASRLLALEGTDTVAIPVIGRVLPFTLRNPARHILLPSRDHYLRLDRLQDGPVPADSLDVQLQSDFFLGPDAFGDPDMSEPGEDSRSES